LSPKIQEKQRVHHRPRQRIPCCWVNFMPGTNLVLDPPRVGTRGAELSPRWPTKPGFEAVVEVPFVRARGATGTAVWTEDTTSELRCRRRTGQPNCNTPHRQGPRQHALIAGKTVGKNQRSSTCHHNLALWCSPEQVEFYLIDFKKRRGIQVFTPPSTAACAGGGD